MELKKLPCGVIPLGQLLLFGYPESVQKLVHGYFVEFYVGVLKTN